MNFELLHPAEQLVMIMERIYDYGMTTTSGGNLSIMDELGDIWITPAGVDKGSLTVKDIVCVKKNGEIVGNHIPSSEFPFHQLVYETRPDLKAVLHAHPPAMVAFSIVRKLPNTRLVQNTHEVCGGLGMAEYGLPGSQLLGEKIAEVFKKGINTVILENHGIVVGSKDLFQAFMAFETLDFSARLEIEAHVIGTPRPLTKEQIQVSKQKKDPHLDTFVPEAYSSIERAVRRDMCQLIHRAYDQHLFTSTQGTFSQRLPDGTMVITPFRKDRKYVGAVDLVKVKDGKRETGKVPSRAAYLHEAIYKKHPHIQSVIIAHPPNIMAFAITECEFDSRTIPESYILLRDIPKLPFGSNLVEPEKVVDAFNDETPIVMIENDCVVVTGDSLLKAFDRLEVLEYSAKAIIASKRLGDIIKIGGADIDDLHVAFNL